eukprot:gene9309-11411_t
MSSPSKRVCRMYRDFCQKHLGNQIVSIRLSSSAELISISEALKQKHNIQHLNLSHNKSIKDLESWIAFGIALKNPSQTLVQLDLSHNYFGPEGLSPIISDIIKSNRSITWLNLSHNNLDQDENHSILEALSHNQTLTHLDLSCNEYQLSQDISTALCTYLSRTKSLTHLNFSHNSTRYPLHGLSNVLANNFNIRSIDLSYMTIADSDGVDFIRAVINSRSLTSIQLNQCLLSTSNEAFGVHITSAIAKRYKDFDSQDELLSNVNSSSITSNQQPPSQQQKNLLASSHSCSFSSASSSSVISLTSSAAAVDDEEEFFKSSPLINLNLGGINFGKRGLKTFLNILLRNQDLTSLDLSSNQLSESNGTLLGDFIRRNQSIQILNISNNDFYEKTVDIAESLQSNQSITDLSLSNSKASNLIGKVLARSLSINRTLKKLNLSHTKLGYSGVLDLCHGLKENHIVLESLNLDDTDLGEKGSIAIGDALRTNSTLTCLHLNFNSIERFGARSIGRSLKSNQTLRILHLGYNQIGVKGLKSISKALRINRSLVDLSIKNNLIPEKGGILLTESLKINQKLEILNLRGNFLGAKGGIAISKLLLQNHVITSIDLSHNHLNKEIVHKIYQSLKKNQSITTVNLSQNEDPSDGSSQLSPPPLSSSSSSLMLPETTTITNIDLVVVNNHGEISPNQIRPFITPPTTPRIQLTPTLSTNSIIVQQPTSNSNVTSPTTTLSISPISQPPTTPRSMTLMSLPTSPPMINSSFSTLPTTPRTPRSTNISIGSNQNILNVPSSSSSSSTSVDNHNVLFTNGQSSQLNGKIWHITDTHYDFLYRTGGDPLKMCREIPPVTPTPSPTSHSEDELNHHHHPSSNIASAVGNYRCDTPYLLLKSAFEFMAKTEPNPDFIIWTGDDPPHFSVDQLNQSLVLDSISNMTNMILDYFPNTRIFPSIGNHDTYPEHQIPIGPNWLFEAVADMWTPFLSNESLTTLRKGGYYTELVEPGFRIISVNTVFYYTQNKQCLNLTDPADQFQWLNDTLYQASLNNERVWIIGHVPPGYNEKYDIYNFHKEFNDQYLEVFSNYSGIIVTHIYGHEHSDAFRLYFDSPTSVFQDVLPTGIMFITPSITPWLNPWVPALPNNPSLRQFHYNTTGFDLVDYDQYWTNLTDNIAKDEINWLYEYRATDFYHVASLDPVSMYESYLLLDKIPEMLVQYHLFNSVSYPSKGCDDVCRRIQLCSIRSPYTTTFDECLVMI